MGQEISVTPVQMVSAVSAIANGGTLYKPRVVREIARRTCGANDSGSRSAAGARSGYGGDAAGNDGDGDRRHGQSAALNGYSVAGKTGTAQKIDHGAVFAEPIHFVVHRIYSGKYTRCDNSGGDRFAGGGASRRRGWRARFQRVAEQVLAYLDVPHDLPFLRRATAKNSDQRAAATETSARRDRDDDRAGNESVSEARKSANGASKPGRADDRVCEIRKRWRFRTSRGRRFAALRRRVRGSGLTPR